MENKLGADLCIDNPGVVGLIIVKDGTPYVTITDTDTGKSVCITIEPETGMRLHGVITTALDVLDVEDGVLLSSPRNGALSLVMKADTR